MENLESFLDTLRDALSGNDGLSAISEESTAAMNEIRQRYADGTYLELKEQDIMKVLKASYIAKRFFGKSRSWISHKLNHDMIGGKPDDFNADERKTLVFALRTIAMELDNLADDIAVSEPEE